MRKLFCLILSISCVCSMVSPTFCQESTKTYVNDEIGFSIEHPASWKNTKVKGGNIVVLFTGGTINRNVQVIYDKGGEQGGKAALERLAKILPNQKVKSAEWKEVNGRRSFLQVVGWQSIIGDNCAIRLMVPVEDHYFLVMGVCPAEEFATLSPLLEKCVLSFNITN